MNLRYNDNYFNPRWGDFVKEGNYYYFNSCHYGKSERFLPCNENERYLISECGRIWDRQNKRLLKKYMSKSNKYPYLYCFLGDWTGSVDFSTQRYVNKLVFTHFVDNTAHSITEEDIIHIDGNKYNCCYDNLTIDSNKYYMEQLAKELFIKKIT